MSKTLLIDGDNLLKIGFHGVKEFYHKGEHVGGIWYFLNTIRKLIEEINYDKVVVFWDPIDSIISRKIIYPQYKKKKTVDEPKENSFVRQKLKVKQYLEEVFIRQIEFECTESDDLIAYYCQISENEFKTIFSSDRDLTQLIGEKVQVYSPNTKQHYKNGDKIKIYNYEFPHYNIATYKILAGDKSDNIDGIYLLGEKTLVKLFPELLDSKVLIDDILKRAEEMIKEDKDNVALKNLLSGKTKSGIYENEFFEVNKKIIDLSEPLLTDEAKQLVELYYKESLDPTDRGYKNLMKMMMEDGLFKYLSKSDDAWINFLKPFLKITRKEKKHQTKN